MPEPESELDEVLLEQAEYLLVHRYDHSPPVAGCGDCARAESLTRILLSPFTESQE